LHYVETQHQFNARESDWGFVKFMPLCDLFDPASGYLVNDTLIVQVDVKVTRNVDEKDGAEHLRVSRYSYVL
jgi:ubiquitin carboxyl-terminal hydrolase 7